MADAVFDYSVFGRRQDYNTAIDHFTAVKEVVARLRGEQMADVVNELLRDNVLIPSQVAPILHAVLVDKLEYAVKSFNFKSAAVFNPHWVKLFQGWVEADLLCVTHDLAGNTVVLSPKRELHGPMEFEHHALMVVYANCPDKTKKAAIANETAEIFQGKRRESYTADSLQRSRAEKEDPFESAPRPARKSYEEAAPAAKRRSYEPEPPPEKKSAPSGKIVKSPLVSVMVTNELFHNGNVEAWKRIIASYEEKHPGARVNVYYNQEKIDNLNALFEWGKVKSGTPIMFSVHAPEIQNLAKLRKILSEGASNRFEVFLKGAPHQTLRLF